MPNRFMTVKVTSQGKNPINFIRDIEIRFYPELQQRLVELSDDTVNTMRSIIDSSKKRPKTTGNKLEHAIEREILSSIGGVQIGIGNISTLKSQAPYFEVLDAGGYIPNYGNLVPSGQFFPGDPQPNASSFRQGQWQPGTGQHSFRAKKPIDGINYIGLSAKYLKDKLDKETRPWIYKQLKNLAK